MTPASLVNTRIASGVVPFQFVTAAPRRRARIIMTAVFWLLSLLPLSWAQALGAWLGAGAARLPGRYGTRLQQNYLQAFPERTLAQLQEARRAAGRMLLETPYFWMRNNPVEGLNIAPANFHEATDVLLARGKGLILLSPHLGGFELLGPLFAQRYPSTVLFKPPHRPWLRDWVERTRSRPNLAMAPATPRGVRMLVKALKRGETIGILPDQCPGGGEGDWAPFFGKSAYTMNLVQRLQALSDAPIVLVFAERLPGARSYHIHMEVLTEPLSSDRQTAASHLNSKLEQLIARAPEQYLWGYNRYKHPRGA
ncbi:lysophospholipid acyltransferase family protein [Silvimonas sp.]|uniref:lysophospholipid acyltransferase family protein n=1 Tax=Silvimonas sp. TaxID=2650811 RepID=UPI002846C4B4|nr:lysophospholipid acyltransferase family protein [Silvimonas sp.]MDR3430192.1 lysophospholipid acyltransferase family protein [Silvimonas sp.]